MTVQNTTTRQDASTLAGPAKAVQAPRSSETKPASQTSRGAPAWFSEHREELMAYAIKHFRISAHCADDIVQAVYLRMKNTESEIQNPRQYAYKITHNLCIDLKRKEKAIAAVNDHVAAHGHTQNEICPERTHSARQLLSKLNKVIWNMPEKRRKLFTMHRFQELSFAEIGRRTGLSESGVRKHISKALAECHQAMEDENV